MMGVESDYTLDLFNAIKYYIFELQNIQLMSD